MEFVCLFSSTFIFLISRDEIAYALSMLQKKKEVNIATSVLDLKKNIKECIVFVSRILGRLKE
jgi:hypothetical protein